MNDEKLLIFAGTYEGRRLCERLSRKFSNITACVATEYGEEKLSGIKNTSVHTGRMNAEEMTEFMRQQGFALIVDGTHPYAEAVTENIKKAADNLGISYFRLLREVGTSENIDVSSACGLAVRVKNAEEAVSYLSKTEGNVLLTTGSKELSTYTKLADYTERLVIRVLPAHEVLTACRELGFHSERIIAVQGPFSAKWNEAMLEQYHCKYLVTKDTGLPGGLEEKLAAAKSAGAKLLIVDRPPQEAGYTMSELIREMEKRFDCVLGFDESCEKKKSVELAPLDAEVNAQRFFPFFLPSKGRRFLVVGGGKIAERRVHSLLQFSFAVTVVSPVLTEGLRILAENGTFVHRARTFIEGDLHGIDAAVVATDDREVNKTAGQLARKQGIPVSVADSREECSFYFPGIVTDGVVTVGIAGDGRNHKKVRETADKIREGIEQR